MAKQKPTYEEEMQALDEQRRNALEQGDYRSYAYLCDQLGFDPEDELAYERGIMESEIERRGDLEEPSEDVGGLEEVVKEVVIDNSKFKEVRRSYLSGEHLREQGNLKTDSLANYSNWIADAFLDFTQRQNGYGLRVESSSGVSSGRMNRVWMNALFYERIAGRGRYRTEYSAGFDESHDDMDKTRHEDYRQEQLNLLKELVLRRVPDANVVVKGNCLYVFKKS